MKIALVATFQLFLVSFVFSHNYNGLQQKGVVAEFFNKTTLSGKPALKRIDERIQFQWTLFSPDPVINYDFYSVG